MVSRSSSACVGCSWQPSPAFRMGHETWRARRWQAPEEGWRTTIASGRIASRLRAVSASVSPFDTLEPEAPMLMVSAESRLAAISNERSEEHTSELQSPCNLVCRLLLEKKKKKATKLVRV